MALKRFVVEMDDYMATVLKNSGQIRIVESENMSESAELVPHKMYRIAHNAQNASLRGKAVVFFGYREAAGGDIRRAKVALVNTDGSTGEEFLVNQAILIPV